VSALSNFVWGIADVLRGPYKPNQYGNVILPFTILRRLECVMEPYRAVMADVIANSTNDVARRSMLRQRTRSEGQPGLTFWNTSAYTLDKALEDPDNLAANLIDYVNGFSSEIDVFRSFGFEAQINELHAYDRLALVTRSFAKIDLHPGAVDNAAMGDLFENLIYRFAEESNEHAGDFYTPRDAIRLLVDLVFADDTNALRERGTIRSVYDPTAGTGGMLSVAEEHLRTMNPDGRLSLFAQEVNAHSYAICKSDLLIKGQDVSQVRQGDTLADDKFSDRYFDFILSNPPFGQDWKASEDEVRREHELGARGRFAPGLPAIGDGAMLFLLHVVAKLRPVDENGNGGRAGIVLNGSPLFNGGAGSGPSDIRGYLLENDLVEAIVALPNDMFYNTGIATYLWVLDNSKAPERRGKVQLIDSTAFATKMRRSLGNKRVEVAEADRTRVVQTYATMAESDISRVFGNLDFAYWSVTVERPLRLNFACTPERIAIVAESKSLAKVAGLVEVLESFGTEVYRNRGAFMRALGRHLGSNDLGLTTAQRKGLWQALGERDEDADTCVDSNGNPEPDPGLRDTEIVPFGWGDHAKEHDARDETIADNFEAEVRPHVPDAWIDHTKTRVGYEIPFTRHFYRYVPPRLLEEIDSDLNKVVAEIIDMLREVEA
jgi:type I restriction enzyme M protein